MDSQGATPVISAGRMLRAAREAQGLHVAALAVSLKVPVKKLELLEADAYDQLPDAVFTRALASSVCRALKINAKPVLDRLPQTVSPRLVSVDPAKSTPFQSLSDNKAQGMIPQINRPAAFAVVALLLAALVLIFLPDVTSLRPAEQAAANTTSPSNGVLMGQVTGLPSTITEAVAVTPNATPAEAPSQVTAAVSAGNNPTTATSAISSTTVAQSTPTVPSPTLVITPSLSAVSTGTASTAAAITDVPEGSLVVFKATGDTWVEVTTGKGKVVISRLLKAGDTVGAAGTTPMSVVVGRADMAQVTVRGQDFDLKPVASKDLVARFKVN